eukprot:3226084-Pyramimonas_sp.AAC.1
MPPACVCSLAAPPPVLVRLGPRSHTAACASAPGCGRDAAPRPLPGSVSTGWPPGHSSRDVPRCGCPPSSCSPSAVMLRPCLLSCRQTI